MLISQSALTVTVQQLEEIVGIALFNRTTRRVVLTEAGSAFLPGARSLLQDLRLILGELETFVNLDRGCVRMAALPSISAEWLPAAVSRFSQNHPKIDFEIYTEDSRTIFDKLLNREIDFGVVGQIFPNPEISSRKIASQPVALICAPDHPLAKRGSAVKWMELAGLDFIHAGNNDSIGSVLEELPILKETFLKTRYKSNKANIVAALVREGVGVTAVTPVVIPREIRAELVVLPLVDPEVSRNIYLVRRHDVSQLPVTKEFITYLVEQVSTARMPQ